MKLAYKYDPKTRIYIEDVVLMPDPSTDINAPAKYTLPVNTTDIQPIGLHKPKWNGKSWIEADTQAAFNAMVSNAKMRIETAYQDAIDALTAVYTQAEQKTWATQLEQAKAFTANASAATPALDALVAARGSTKTVIAPIIIAKAEALELASLSLTGKYQKLIAAIDALALVATTTQADLDAIIW